MAVAKVRRGLALGWGWVSERVVRMKEKVRKKRKAAVTPWTIKKNWSKRQERWFMGGKKKRRPTRAKER